MGLSVTRWWAFAVIIELELLIGFGLLLWHRTPTPHTATCVPRASLPDVPRAQMGPQYFVIACEPPPPPEPETTVGPEYFLKQWELE